MSARLIAWIVLATIIATTFAAVPSFTGTDAAENIDEIAYECEAPTDALPEGFML